MKQRLVWILAIAMLLCALVVILWPTKPVVRPRIELSFLCFSNRPASPEVIFMVHFPKNYGGSGWKEVELEHWEGGQWKRWNPEARPRPEMQLRGSRLLGTVASNGRRVDLLASYALSDTNDSWRIRTHVEEEPPLAFWERFRFFSRNRRQGSSPPTDSTKLFSYWMTNVVGTATSGK